MPLPPGVSARDFQTVLRQFEGVAGKEWVFSSDEDVELYRDSYSPFWQEPECSIVGNHSSLCFL